MEGFLQQLASQQLQAGSQGSQPARDTVQSQATSSNAAAASALNQALTELLGGGVQAARSPTDQLLASAAALLNPGSLSLPSNQVALLANSSSFNMGNNLNQQQLLGSNNSLNLSALQAQLEQQSQVRLQVQAAILAGQLDDSTLLRLLQESASQQGYKTGGGGAVGGGGVGVRAGRSNSSNNLSQQQGASSQVQPGGGQPGTPQQHFPGNSTQGEQQLRMPEFRQQPQLQAQQPLPAPSFSTMATPSRDGAPASAVQPATGASPQQSPTQRPQSGDSNPQGATSRGGGRGAGGGGGGGEEGGGSAQKGRARARRGQATDPHSIAERLRRERIADRMKALQDLVPNSNRSDKASMLDEIIDYVKFLQLIVKVLNLGRLGGPAADAVTGLLSDLPAQAPEDASAALLPEDLASTERQVARLLEQDVGSAMQFLQSQGLVLMPATLAALMDPSYTEGQAQEPVEAEGKGQEEKGAEPSTGKAQQQLVPSLVKQEEGERDTQIEQEGQMAGDFGAQDDGRGMAPELTGGEGSGGEGGPVTDGDVEMTDAVPDTDRTEGESRGNGGAPAEGRGESAQGELAGSRGGSESMEWGPGAGQGGCREAAAAAVSAADGESSRELAQSMVGLSASAAAAAAAEAEAEAGGRPEESRREAEEKYSGSRSADERTAVRQSS